MPSQKITRWREFYEKDAAWAATGLFVRGPASYGRQIGPGPIRQNVSNLSECARSRAKAEHQETAS